MTAHALVAGYTSRLVKGTVSRIEHIDWLRICLIGLTVAVMFVLLILPLAIVFVTAFRAGLGTYWSAVTHPHTLAALKLTLIAVFISVPINVVFGVSAAWLITRHNPPGRTVLLSLIDLPFTISPVVTGLMFVLIFGSQSLFGAWLLEHGIRVVFAVPGIVLATVFVTLPFVARELIPVMEAAGPEEELAGVSLGAWGWKLIRRVTLPSVRWGLAYGIILCTARAIGEFGAVSVVSGHIRGRTNTIPLHIEVLFNEYQTAAAFAVASLLTLFAVITLVLKEGIVRRMETASPPDKKEHTR
ncbi:MAG: sulfate ABC transporter permease subunit CysW [bacterium]